MYKRQNDDSTEISVVLSHTQALSQCSEFIKKNNINENVRADTAGSAALIAKNKIKNDAAIASKLSAEIYKLDIIVPNIVPEKVTSNELYFCCITHIFSAKIQ